MSEGIRVVAGAAVTVLVAGLLTYLLLRAVGRNRQQHTDLPAEEDMTALERGRCMECREWQNLNQLVLTGGVCFNCRSRRGSSNECRRV
ncbi:hypothetical protein A5724_25650 [Mycobacterium sp. ACS1612]|uniref:hypothetical protein n=1 Tax=Mycobacterium sp. ACS1612 TaxID=1834117 RepID=UPI0007FBC193|nr:hypothetical protein [Mycobacterium sp. ACS1612]OBF29344.1 hypothetical protein A5724_25650 [Mycobacterium sp. ACS1612]